jgi:DNA polymerase-3 subunit epsilon
MKIIIFDTETTGLPPRDTPTHKVLLWPHIVQFSYIIFDTDTNTIDKISDSIIKVSVDIPEESSKIHGITNEISSEKGVLIKKVIKQFMKDMVAFNCELIVAHNIEFDLDMILVEITRLNKIQLYIGEFMKYDKFCTMKTTEKMCNIKAVSKTGKEYTKYPTLGELHYYLFCTYPTNLHNSLNDILICLRCYYKLTFKEDILNKNTYIDELLNPLIC